MADDIEKTKALRAIRDALTEQLLQLEQLGGFSAVGDLAWVAGDLSLVIDRINKQLGEAPSEEEIERRRRNLFLN
ncbi:hypothetical protein FG91_02267 [Sphingopyxis sp. LC81]|jgi:hypothetical protein|uniref:hypothetical protein n=1 Tax=Sphingopyxis sp. LC81 TaxID=1502850 RepID=UPI00050F25EA|nr:hypothetical protein [Sphingopyxis sp. LC81]KGB54020.1 hypothetical protein FG91_02267 [Sphingopyxis sp. LC81]